MLACFSLPTLRGRQLLGASYDADYLSTISPQKGAGGRRRTGRRLSGISGIRAGRAVVHFRRRWEVNPGLQ
jgi:hypothetical protein